MQENRGDNRRGRDLFSLSAYHYDLPEELIAQYPSERRGDSRLMCVDRATGEITIHPFAALEEMLQEGDQLILNDTKVIPARLKGKRASGGNIELFLSRPLADGCWEVLAKPAKKLRVGERIV